MCAPLETVKNINAVTQLPSTRVIYWYTDLIDECHGIHQQLCIHSIFLIQDLHDV